MLDRSIRTTTQQQPGTAAAMVHVRYVSERGQPARQMLGRMAALPGPSYTVEAHAPIETESAGDRHLQLIRSIHRPGWRPCRGHNYFRGEADGESATERIPAPRRRARMADASDRRTARTCGQASSSSGSCHDIQGSKSVCGTIHKCCEMIHDPFRFYFCSELISSLMLVRLA